MNNLDEYAPQNRKKINKYFLKNYFLKKKLHRCDQYN